MENNKKFLFILIVIILSYGLTNWLWIKNTSPEFPQCYASVHYEPLIECFNKLKAIGSLNNIISLRKLGFIFGESHEYPVLIPTITATACLIFGRSALSVMGANLFYLAILLIAAYFIAKKIVGSSAGRLSVMFISLFPAIYGPSRLFLLEVGEAAFVCLSICTLLYSEDFKNRKYSLLFALSCGLGMLTKDTFITFIIGPLCFISGSVIFSFFRTREKNKYVKQLWNMVIALVIVLLLSSYYYFGLNNFISSFSKLFHEPQPLLVSYYIRDLVNNQITPFYFILLIWGIFVLIKLKSIKINVIFLLWVIIPALIYTFMPHWRSGRFVIPYLPAIGIIIGIGISRIRFSLLKNIIIVLSLVYGLIYFSDLSFDSDLIPLSIKEFLQVEGSERLSFAPKRHDEFINIKKFIIPQIREKQEKSKILFLPGCGNLGVEMYFWRVNFWSENLDQQLEMISNFNSNDYAETLKLILKDMGEADYILSSIDIKQDNAYEYLTKISRQCMNIIPDNNIESVYKNDFLKRRKNFKFLARCDDLLFFRKK